MVTLVRKFVVAKVERKFYVDVFLVDKVSWTGNLGLGKGCVSRRNRLGMSGAGVPRYAEVTEETLF